VLQTASSAEAVDYSATDAESLKPASGRDVMTSAQLSGEH
jgi:hypothetical protein